MNLNPVFVHQIFGALVLAFAIVMLLRELDALGARWDYLPAAAPLLLGALLFADPWLFHGGDFGAEGHQHTWQGLFVVAAGAIEWGRIRRKSRHVLLLLVFPLLLAALGVGFLRHEQHQSGDMLLQTVQHRIMGMTLLGRRARQARREPALARRAVGARWLDVDLDRVRLGAPALRRSRRSWRPLSGLRNSDERSLDSEKASGIVVDRIIAHRRRGAGA